MSELSLPVFGILVVGLALIAAGVGGMAVNMDSEPASIEAQPSNDTVNDTSGIDLQEERYVEEVPERGDPYFEAEASDGSWISYVNPRDEYRDPYLGDGSGKFCVSLYNANGEVAVGETVPNTTVTVPTGESLAWHSHADPFVVELPLTEHYERPLDSDQFGTDPDLPQGDGYLDSHCMEIHGMAADGTVEYGEAEIDGEYEDRIEIVGYVQQDAQSWETDVDPLADARSYEEAGGGWTYDPDHSHGQMVVVLQIDHGDADTDDTGQDDSTTDENHSSDDSTTDENHSSDGSAAESSGADRSDVDDSLSGFGLVVAVVAVLVVALCARSR